MNAPGEDVLCSLIEEHKGVEVVRSEGKLAFMSEPLPTSDPGFRRGDSDLDEKDPVSDPGKQQIEVPEERSWKKLFAFLGPGFLVCIAYIDPANFESDLQAGAKFQYELLWVLLLAAVGGFIIQSLAASLGVVTGKHLAEHCRAEYPSKLNLTLWILAEIAIVASDIPEVIGTAFALNMLFGLEVWVGVLLTGGSTLAVLMLQHYGVRKLEVFIALLVCVIAGCYIVEFFYVEPNLLELAEGVVLPRLRDSEATAIAISVFGANVMPHNLYLHSALVLSRKPARTNQGIRDGRRYFILEMIVAMVLAFVINVAVIGVAGQVCNTANISADIVQKCRDLDLNHAPILLTNTLGKWSSTLFAIGLLASGQSSAVTGTYAGQYVMQGFLELKIKPVYRNLLTRIVAIVPSLAVAVIGGSRGSGQLIIVSSIVLSFELPFALIPLLKFTSDPIKMGPFVNHMLVTVGVWILGLCVIGLNVYFIADLIVSKIYESKMHAGWLFVLAFITFVAMLLYIMAAAYLALRQDTEVTYVSLDDYGSGTELCNLDSDLEALPQHLTLADSEAEFDVVNRDKKSMQNGSPEDFPDYKPVRGTSPKHENSRLEVGDDG